MAYSIRRPDRKVLQNAARALKSDLSSPHGVYGIVGNLSPGKRQLEIESTPAGKAAGLSTAALGAQLRTRLRANEAQRIQRGRDELKVAANHPPEKRRSPSELARIRPDRPSRGQVQLSDAAFLFERQELAELTRIDGMPTVFVEAKAHDAIIAPNRDRRQVEKGIIQELRSKHPGIVIEREGAGRDESETIETLRILLPLALVAICAVIASFLRSYWKPLNV